mgnify:CR=1 FL=1
MGAFGLGTIHLGDGGEAKGGSVAKTLIPGSRRRLVRGDPRHRHATAIAALFIITLGGEVRSWVLKTIPRNICYLEQAQFLSLIHIYRTW